jgi:hypothetical protein
VVWHSFTQSEKGEDNGEPQMAGSTSRGGHLLLK